VTADTALRLAKALGTTPDFWLNLQQQYDLDCARDAAKDLSRIEPIGAGKTG
jgi:plasmid maintenance system antidote protein VapI